MQSLAIGVVFPIRISCRAFIMPGVLTGLILIGLVRLEPVMEGLWLIGFKETQMRTILFKLLNKFI